MKYLPNRLKIFKLNLGYNKLGEYCENSKWLGELMK